MPLAYYIRKWVICNSYSPIGLSTRYAGLGRPFLHRNSLVDGKHGRQSSCLRAMWVRLRHNTWVRQRKEVSCWNSLSAVIPFIHVHPTTCHGDFLLFLMPGFRLFKLALGPCSLSYHHFWPIPMLPGVARHRTSALFAQPFWLQLTKHHLSSSGSLGSTLPILVVGGSVIRRYTLVGLRVVTHEIQ